MALFGHKWKCVLFCSSVVMDFLVDYECEMVSFQRLPCPHSSSPHLSLFVLTKVNCVYVGSFCCISYISFFFFSFFTLSIYTSMVIHVTWTSLCVMLWVYFNIKKYLKFKLLFLAYSIHLVNFLI